MELIDQHTKKIMEGCKERAREAGLSFQDETLEYIVTNRDLLELSPKVMIPTLYDYWVHDVEVLKEKGKYELYPGNPYETVINTRPAISFYNDNNPDWLNVMIFYHVIGHIDFFQNNLFFRHTWDYDFTGQALSDKRLIAKLRSEKGRWVDYVIEFTRSIDNLTGYYDQLSSIFREPSHTTSGRVDYYFDVFLQNVRKVRISEYIKEIEAYNKAIGDYGKLGESSFFSDVEKKYPEFQTLFKKYSAEKHEPVSDLIQYIMAHSRILDREENQWMKSVMEVIRNTSIFFQPQIRTKIMNEGWASYWHETLFLKDDRIKGHEVDFARVNAYVTAMPRVGLNPYALGMRLFQYIETLADKGKTTYEFQKEADFGKRRKWDRNTGEGRAFIFDIRENLSDYLFVTRFVDQDFVDLHRLFVAGKRLNQAKMVWEYYVKSRSAEAYKKMLMDSLYHPPKIEVNKPMTEGSRDNTLYMVHRFEEKPLVAEYISNTMMGIEFLWGNAVQLETHEVATLTPYPDEPDRDPEVGWRKVLYTMKNRRLSKRTL